MREGEMTPLLTPQDRADLASYLRDNAPDDILIRAVEQVKEYRENVRQDLASIKRYIGSRITNVTPANIEPEPYKFGDAILRKPNFIEPKEDEPPGNPVSRISVKSKMLIKQALKQPRLPNCLGQKYIGHFKLMWQRGEIQWNGKEYYL